MNERDFAVWLATRGTLVVVGVWVFFRVIRWAEDRGYVYGTRNKPKPGGVTHAALEAQRLLESPAAEHRLEAEDPQVQRADNDGD